MTNAIEQQLQAAQQALQAAQQAKQRQAASDPDHQIAVAQAQITALELEGWRQGILKRSQPFHAMVSELHGLYAEIVGALERVDLAAAATLTQSANALRAQAVRLAEVIRDEVSQKSNPLWVDAYAANGGKPSEPEWGKDAVAEERAKRAADAAVTRLNSLNLEPPKPLFDTLIQWVTALPDGYQRQQRRGLCYALVGWFCDPTLDALFNSVISPHYAP